MRFCQHRRKSPHHRREKKFDEATKANPQREYRNWGPTEGNSNPLRLFNHLCQLIGQRGRERATEAEPSHQPLILALDQATGMERWEWRGPEPGSASPILIEFEGDAQIVTLTDGQIIEPGRGGRPTPLVRALPRRVARKRGDAALDRLTTYCVGPAPRKSPLDPPADQWLLGNHTDLEEHRRGGAHDFADLRRPG